MFNKLRKVASGIVVIGCCVMLLSLVLFVSVRVYFCFFKVALLFLFLVVRGVNLGLESARQALVYCYQ
jgi:hypothetical protein